MARFSGATVLLILVATVSVYTCAILAGAALGRALDSPGRTMTKQPWARDVALRFRVSFRGLAEDLAKELWGGNHGEEGRSGGGARRAGHGYRGSVEAPDAARVSQRHTRAKLEQQRDYMRVIQAELEYHRCHHMVAQRAASRSLRETSRRDGVYEGGATAMPVSSDSDAELWGGGYRGEEGRSGGRGHAGVDGAAAIEYQRCHRMLERRAATRARRESSRSYGVYEAGAAAATAVPVPVSSETELWRGYDREGGRSGGRAHAGAGDRAAAEALPSSASVPLSPAELQDRQRQRREEGRPGAGAAASLSPADRQRAMRQIDRMRIEMWRRGLLSNFSGAITDWARPGAAGGVVKVGPWGGSGGQAFYMPPGEEGAPRLLSITLYHADAVHALSFEYLLGGVGVGRTMGPSGGGGRSRGLRETINFAPDEHLTVVEGTFGRCVSLPAQVVVTSLTFRTDKGRTHGPYGEETGTPFSVPAADGCIVGFWGRSGWLLDAIGVYIMPTCQVNDPTSFVTN